MIRIEKIDENTKQVILNSVRDDVLRHVFLIYDLERDPEHTTVVAAIENNLLRGYILNYAATDVPSTVLESDPAAADLLIRYAPNDHFILHSQRDLLPVIQRYYPHEKHYVENWMLVKEGEATYFRSTEVRPLRPKDDALKLTILLATRGDRSQRMIKRYAEWISRMRVHGVFIRGNLVSCAGAFIQLPQVWMIGGVYTHPKHRGMGYGTLATSAITEDALKNAEASALFVRSDNYPAVRAYEKIGYRKIGEKLWVDIGTGMSP